MICMEDTFCKQQSFFLVVSQVEDLWFDRAVIWPQEYLNLHSVASLHDSK